MPKFLTFLINKSQSRNQKPLMHVAPGSTSHISHGEMTIGPMLSALYSFRCIGCSSSVKQRCGCKAWNKPNVKPRQKCQAELNPSCQALFQMCFHGKIIHFWAGFAQLSSASLFEPWGSCGAARSLSQFWDKAVLES